MDSLLTYLPASILAYLVRCTFFRFSFSLCPPDPMSSYFIFVLIYFLLMDRRSMTIKAEGIWYRRSSMSTKPASSGPTFLATPVSARRWSPRARSVEDFFWKILISLTLIIIIIIPHCCPLDPVPTSLPHPALLSSVGFLQNGDEDLAKHLNSYFELLIRTLMGFGKSNDPI